MKTHQLARALQQLSVALRALPNIELEQFTKELQSSGVASSSSVAVNVATLAALSRIGKREWLDLISQWQLPLNVPRKDSSRNIMGQVLKYLETHPQEIRRLQQGASSKGSKASPALLKALSILMAESPNEEPQS